MSSNNVSVKASRKWSCAGVQNPKNAFVAKQIRCDTLDDKWLILGPYIFPWDILRKFQITENWQRPVCADPLHIQHCRQLVSHYC